MGVTSFTKGIKKINHETNQQKNTRASYPIGRLE